ncbi:AAA family ATPase [Mycobacterium colombiense]
MVQRRNPLYADDFDIERALAEGIPPTKWHGAPCLWVKGYQHSLVGPSEVGKTLLMSDLAARMALRKLPVGLSVPDGDDCDDDVRMLYLDAENSQRDVVRRFGLMQYEYNGELRKRLFYRSFPDISPLNSPEGAGRVIEFIETKRINFVVADTLSKFIDGNENDPGPYTEFSKHLLNYFRKREITSVWFDHTGHVEKRARGSSAKKDNWDAGWRLELKERNASTGISKIEMTPDKNRSGALAPRLWVTRYGAPLPYIRHEFSMRMPEREVTEDVIANAQEPMHVKKKHLRELLVANEDHVRTLGGVNKIRAWAKEQGASFTVTKMNEVIVDFLTPVEG